MLTTAPFPLEGRRILLLAGDTLSQVEVFRPGDLGLGAAALEKLQTPAVAALIAGGNTNTVRMRIAELLHAGRD